MSYALKFQIGARTLFRIPRQLERCALTLEDALAGAPPVLPALHRAAHGYVVTSLPASLLGALLLDSPGLRPVVRQSYTRYYADLGGGFDAYLAGFSPKSRSTLLRKVRRFAETEGGVIDVRAYRTPEELAIFHELAREVSRKSYQERLLDAGLPEDVAASAALARADGLRAFLLFRGGRPISYLYLPAIGRTLVYAHLGFDPGSRDLSPGTILQFEAMRLLMEENRFARLDFTEGEGQHKRQFATGGVDCVDLLLLRPSLGNVLAVGALGSFDRAVARVKALVDRPVLRPLGRALRR